MISFRQFARQHHSFSGGPSNVNFSPPVSGGPSQGPSNISSQSDRRFRRKDHFNSNNDSRHDNQSQSGSDSPSMDMPHSYPIGTREPHSSTAHDSFGMNSTGLPPPPAAHLDSYDSSPVSDNRSRLDDSFGFRGRTVSSGRGGDFGPPAHLPPAPPMTPYSSHYSAEHGPASRVGPGIGRMGNSHRPTGAGSSTAHNSFGIDSTGPLPPPAAYSNSYDSSPIPDNFGSRRRTVSSGRGGDFGPPSRLPSAPPMTPNLSHYSAEHERVPSVGPGIARMGYNHRPTGVDSSTAHNSFGMNSTGPLPPLSVYTNSYDSFPIPDNFAFRRRRGSSGRSSDFGPPPAPPMTRYPSPYTAEHRRTSSVSPGIGEMGYNHHPTGADYSTTHNFGSRGRRVSSGGGSDFGPPSRLPPAPPMTRYPSPYSADHRRTSSVSPGIGGMGYNHHPTGADSSTAHDSFGMNSTGPPHPPAAYTNPYDSFLVSDNQSRLDGNFGSRGRTVSPGGGGDIVPPVPLPPAPPMSPYPSPYSAEHRRTSSVSPGIGGMGYTGIFGDPHLHRLGGRVMIKFHLEDASYPGISIAEAFQKLRISQGNGHMMRDILPDMESKNILLRVRWSGSRSKTYSIPLSGDFQGYVDLQSLARRTARSVVHFMNVNSLILSWDLVVIHGLEKISPGAWVPVLTTH